MKISEQFCTLKQAKRLKELGVIQKSCFIYNQFSSLEFISYEGYLLDGKDFKPTNCYSAFSAAELGAMLPEYLFDTRLHQWRNPNLNEYRIVYESTDWDGSYDVRMPDESGLIAETEAEVRAKLLIWVLEKNKVSKEEINKILVA